MLSINAVGRPLVLPQLNVLTSKENTIEKSGWGLGWGRWEEGVELWMQR